jgi:release factor glutamine methyltransferase
VTWAPLLIRPAMTLRDHVYAARRRLTQAGVRSTEADLDAELLARHALGCDRAGFLARTSEIAPIGFAERYETLIARRERREPVAYILGTREFWGLDFEVSRDVLVPRPESELIVEEALACISDDEADRRRRVTSNQLAICDVGTGSGCLGIALAMEVPSARVVVTDVSATALTVARRNAVRHGVSERIYFVRADLLEGLKLAPRVIVSNPPYVPRHQAGALAPEVRCHEPLGAILAGSDGMSIINGLLTGADLRLPPGGWLVFEFGFGQEEQVLERVRSCSRLSIVRVRSDLQGIPRTAVLRAAG